MSGAEDNNDDYMKQLEEQRKAFEAQFGSLESMGFEDKTKDVPEFQSEDESKEEDSNSNGESSQEEEESKEEESEEEGNIIPIARGSTVSDNGRVRKPKVIRFDGPSDIYVEPTRAEQKRIRSGKTLAQNSKKEAQREAARIKQHGNNGGEGNEEEDGAQEAENLQNDVELQQFLKESHLLSAFSQSNSANNNAQSGVNLTLESLSSGSKNDTIMYQDNEVMGKARMKTLEHRLRGLSKTNGHDKKINKLEKVPMAMRKGMINKHVKRISKFEQDAADGGIILSKVKKGQFRKIEATYKKDIERRIGSSIKSKDEERAARRERGLKVNSIGRSTRNGLIVSKEEIARINGYNNKGSNGRRSGGSSKGFKKRGRR